VKAAEWRKTQQKAADEYSIQTAVRRFDRPEALNLPIGS